jgi:hypothetical protein
MAEIGGGAGRGLSGADTKDADLLGGIAIELIDPDLRPYSAFAFVAELQEEVRPHPMLETVSFRGGRRPGGRFARRQIFSGRGGHAQGRGRGAEDRALPYPEVSALEDNLAYDKEELVLELTPQGQALGFTIDALGRALRDQLNGIEAATYPDGPRTATIRVELPPGELTPTSSTAMQVRAAPGVYVPLADIVTVDPQARAFPPSGARTACASSPSRATWPRTTPPRGRDQPRRSQETILPRIEERFGVETRLSGLAEQERAFLSDAALRPDPLPRWAST